MHIYIWVFACGMHLCVCVHIYVYPASYMHVPKLSCWSCKFYHCYWIPFHRIPGVVLVVFMSSLSAPRVVLMTVCDAVRDAWRLDFFNRRPPRSGGVVFNTESLPCTKTPDRGCECIFIYSSEYLNLIFFNEEVILCLIMFLDVF